MEKQELEELVKYLQTRLAETVANYELEIGILRLRSLKLESKLGELSVQEQNKESD